MQKTEITLSLDGERLDALEFYLKKENSTVQKRMGKVLDELYEKTVPEPVREYLDHKAPPLSKPKRPARPSPGKAPERTPRREGQTALEKDGAAE